MTRPDGPRVPPDSDGDGVDPWILWFCGGCLLVALFFILLTIGQA